MGPYGAQPLVDSLVAAVDLPDVPDRGGSLRTEARYEHRHARADVRALHPLAVETRRPVDDGAVRVAEDDARAHVHELVDEEQAVLEHLLEDQDGALRLRRDREGDRRQVGRESGPGAVLDLGDLGADVVLDRKLLAARHTHRGAGDLPADSESLERGPDGDEVLGDNVLDDNFALRHRGEADEARPLDVVRADAPFVAAKLVDPADAEDVGADPLDLGAERDEEAAQILHVRLTRGVPYEGLALRKHGRHDHVLGPRDGGLVEEDVCPTQALRPHAIDLLRRDVGAELHERVDVRVEPTAPDDVSPRRRDDRLALAREQRPREENGSPDPAAELFVELELRDPSAGDSYLPAPEALDVGAEV